MTRPQIVRADTLDLQDHDTPSAQDHTRQPSSPAPLGVGRPAPHQEEQLRHMVEERHAEHDTLADQWGSGRSSHEGSELLDEGLRTSMDDLGNGHEARLDEAAVQQNGGEDSEMMDADGEDGADDGMDDTDKISSSPSIDDEKGKVQGSALSEGHHLRQGRSQSHFLQASTRRRTGIRPRGLRATNSPIGLLGVQRTHSATTIVDLEDVLLPDYDPFLGDISAHDFADPIGDEELWESESDSTPEACEGEASDSDDLEDDDSTDNFFLNESRFVDSGWGGQCLQELEDIDFEFVYALHTFVATVEGQANATKGDTMVLLDDSNSYWWLVRVVKDSSIGYLPAEHIETPTERLARLNKHRNIDLSATMLGDNPEKSKNPLKKAMRRRNAKIVQFSTPTYFEPQEVDWSDAEGEREDGNEIDEAPNGQRPHEEEANDTQAVEVADTNGHVTEGQQDNDHPAETQASSTDDDSKIAAEVDPSNEEAADSQASTPNRSRNGTMRNTDSFFKDDTAEPRKISLTPNLLREESNDSSGRSSDSKEKTPAGGDIFDQIERSNSVNEKVKEEKKKKEKRPGVLSGLFKRKDKKIKVDEAVGGVVHKQEGDVPHSPVLSTGFPSSEADQTSPTAPTSPPTTTTEKAAPPKRQASGNKLTKAPPPGLQATSTNAVRSQAIEKPQQVESTEALVSSTPEINQTKDVSPEPSSSTQVPPKEDSTIDTTDVSQEDRTGRILSPTSDPSSSQQKPEKIKREKLKKATQRMDLDVDSSPEREAAESRSLEQSGAVAAPATQSSADNKIMWNGHQPLSIDTSARDNSTSSFDSPPTPFEGAVEGEEFYHEGEPKSSTEISSRSAVTAAESLTTPTASSPATIPAPVTPPQFGSTDYSWNDASLRSYLDNQSHNEVRDLLLVVQDKTGVVPVSHDHPLMKEMGFQEQRKQLDDMSTQLDGLLNGYLARRAARGKKSSQPQRQ